jgi:transglutaminase-like putative cysteine protease
MPSSWLRRRLTGPLALIRPMQRLRSLARYGRLEIEPLEERVLLDAGLPPAIVLGRTLSAPFAGQVQNNQETLIFTVYNEQADPVPGVLLTDTLQPGVTFQSASQLPDRNGSQLAWSLGTIQGFDRASLTLTVSLANPIPLQLDTGAQAFATLDAGAVSNTTPAAVLRPGNVSDPNLLASTPDANTTDPYVQEQAAKLRYDPQQIFSFLQNDIGYNSYLGSVRGARGTLWSSAGNALDVASLGVALMRASGIPAQYVQGTLSQSQAQQLILSMFPSSYQTVGAIPAGTPTADPANDPQLLSETEQHYWFQFDAGQGMQSADPLIPGSQLGQTITTATGTFTAVPDELR